MAGVRKKPNSGGKFRGWFKDSNGKRRFFTGTHSKAETERMARKLEDEHRQVGLGCREASKPHQRNGKRDFREVADEYLAWGEAQGGRGGRPWGECHLRIRRSYLEWWEKALGFEVLADLYGTLGSVEGKLRELQASGLANKTVANYAETIAAFCDWCVERSYLENDPLKGLKGFDTTPQTIRRAMTGEEIEKLMTHCRPTYRLLYEVALASGLRAKELKSLTVSHLDVERSGLRLDAAWTKGRKAGFQPLPAELTAKLAESCRGRGAKAKLLRVPTHTARAFCTDLELAGIPRVTEEGKLDFHALRTTFTTLVIESGANIKEAQALARHSTPQLTMNTYARTRPERLAALSERLGETVLSSSSCAHSVHNASGGNGDGGHNGSVRKTLRKTGPSNLSGFDSHRLHQSFQLPILRSFAHETSFGQLPLDRALLRSYHSRV